MTGMIGGTGSTMNGQTSAVNKMVREAMARSAPVRTSENVSVDGNQINIKIDTTGTLLDKYRKEGVELELSGEQPTEKFTEEELAAMKEEARERSIIQMYQENLEAAKENAEAMGEGMKDMGRALEIARRMMKGDIVPASDEKFLMDHAKDIYLSAKTMQSLAQNKDPKKHDSVLEDEEESESATIKVEGGKISVDVSGLNLCQEMPRE